MNQDATAKDPVCGMNVDPTASLHMERDGQTFYFCSQHCLQQFTAAPAGETGKSGKGCWG